MDAAPAYQDPCLSDMEDAEEKPLPLDLSHHWSQTTKRRTASKMKEYYKYYQIPGIGNIAGGLPHVRFFPFDTLEAQAAKPERWTPSPNYPGETEAVGSGSGSDSDSWVLPADPDPQAAAHISVPKTLDGPADPLRKIDLATALQYGLAQGYPPLLSWVKQFALQHLHPEVPYRGGADVCLSCGSTDGMSKSLEMFVDPWSEELGDDPRDRPGLLCETFVYGNVLSQAQPRGVQIVPVVADAGGMVATGPGGLEDVLANWDYSKGKRPNLMYTVTMGHNPTGIVLSVERRKQIYAVCSKYDVIIVEDDPYWYLQFPSAATEEAKSRHQTPPEATSQTLASAPSSGYPFLDSLVPSFLSIDTDGRVIRLDTFSKTVAPGCRLGFITAQPVLIERFVRIAEASTQQPSGFVQSMVAELAMGQQPEATKSSFLALRTARERAAFAGWQMDGWVRWLAGLRGMYERRMVRMCRILDAGSVQLRTRTPQRAQDAEWGVVTKTPLFDFDWPRGGMFVWLRIRFESHPLWRAATPSGRVIDGQAISFALMIFLTRAPYLVAVAPGLMFSATDRIRAEIGWAYFRLCFAAEAEELIESCSHRFVAGVHRFWHIRDVKELEDLLKDAPSADADADAGAEKDSLQREEEQAMANLGIWLGC